MSTRAICLRYKFDPLAYKSLLSNINYRPDMSSNSIDATRSILKLLKITLSPNLIHSTRQTSPLPFVGLRITPIFQHSTSLLYKVRTTLKLLGPHQYVNPNCISYQRRQNRWLYLSSLGSAKRTELLAPFKRLPYFVRKTIFYLIKL